MTWVTTGEPTIQRQRSRWVVRVSGYDAATGRRRVRQLGTHETKKAAVAHQRAIMDGRAGSDDETLSAYLREVWLPSKDERVEVGTYDQYRWAVEGHIIPLLGAVRLRDLTPEAVDRWVRALVVAEDGERARLSATSARLVRKILSMSMEDAVRRGRVPRNPVSLTQPPKRSRTHRKLGWSLVGLLEDHRTLQAVEAEEAGSAWEVSGLVFTSQLGGWIDPNNFSRLMRDLTASTGVPVITPKGLRHTAQSVGRVVVGDDKVMQERLGHSDVEITLGTYTHVVDKQHRRAGELIDSMFAAPPVAES
ncbi:MAG: tyrosine recombinase XerC [Microthrixaceae bacterium]